MNRHTLFLVFTTNCTNYTNRSTTNTTNYSFNFIMNMVATLAAYCFFDNKPQALDGYYIENSKQLMLF